MKILIILALCFGFSNTTNAQETIKPLKGGLPTDNDANVIYYKDTTNSLDKYFGTWLYDDGTYYFKVTFLKKERVQMGYTNTFHDELVCKYLLKINNTTVYDTYEANNIDEDMANYILGSSIKTENKISLFYTEPPLNDGCQRNASGKLELEYMEFVVTPQLQWTRVNNGIYGGSIGCADGTQMDTSAFKIPASMTLIKQ